MLFMSDGQLVWFRYLAQVAAHGCVLHLVLFMSDGQLVWFQCPAQLAAQL